MAERQRMPSLEKLSLKIRNYKCFEESEQGYETILPINLIIGRNNSGKSTLLDLIDQATSPQDLTPLRHKNRIPSIVFGDMVVEEDIPKENYQAWQGTRAWVPRRELVSWIQTKITWELLSGSTLNNYNFLHFDPPTPEVDSCFNPDDIKKIKTDLAKTKGNPSVYFAQISPKS